MKRVIFVPGRVATALVLFADLLCPALCGIFRADARRDSGLEWKDNLLPLLKKRFPAATDDDLKKAHAFAYGGSLIQDMGYYPLATSISAI